MVSSSGLPRSPCHTVPRPCQTLTVTHQAFTNHPCRGRVGRQREEGEERAFFEGYILKDHIVVIPLPTAGAVVRLLALELQGRKPYAHVLCSWKVSHGCNIESIRTYKHSTARKKTKLCYMFRIYRHTDAHAHTNPHTQVQVGFQTPSTCSYS